MFAVQPQQFLGVPGFPNNFGYGRPINPLLSWTNGVTPYGVMDPVTHELQRIALHYQALQQLALQQQLASIGGVGGQWPLQTGYPVQTTWPIQPLQMSPFAPIGPVTNRYVNPITDQINAFQPQLVPVA